MEQLFPVDNYDTPADSHRDFIDKYLLLGTRWSYHLRGYKIFYDSGNCARKGKLSSSTQVLYSNQFIRLVEKCGGKIHVRGLDNLSQLGGSAVLVGNHMSKLEQPLFHALIRSRMDFTFVVKESLLKVRYFGDVMRSLGAIPVSRRNPREDLKKVLSVGTQVLKEERSIILFPESTRSTTFDPKKFNTIGIKLAKRAGVPIIPFALKTDFVANGKGVLKSFGAIQRDEKVCFEFGKPLYITDGKKEHKQIIEFIQSRLEKWNSK